MKIKLIRSIVNHLVTTKKCKTMLYDVSQLLLTTDLVLTGITNIGSAKSVVKTSKTLIHSICKLDILETKGYKVISDDIRNMLRHMNTLMNLSVEEELAALKSIHELILHIESILIRIRGII